MSMEGQALLEEPCQRTLRAAIILKIGSGLCLVGVAWLVHRLGATYPIGELVFVRSGGMFLAVLAAMLLRRQFWTSIQSSRVGAHVRRGITGTLALALNFVALSMLPLAEAQALYYLAPMIVVILGVWVLGETAGSKVWFCTLLGLAGVGLILFSEIGIQAPRSRVIGILTGGTGAVLTAAALLQVRSLAQTESAMTIALYFSVVGMAAGLATALSGWVWPNPGDLVLFFLLGVAGAGGHVLLALALARASAPQLASLEYLNLLWALIASALSSAPLPGVMSLCGMALIILASAALATPSRVRRTSAG